MTDSAMLNNLAEKAIKVVDRFDVRKIADQWEVLFEEVSCG